MSQKSSRSSMSSCHGQEKLNLRDLMGRSSEVVINIDSQTEIQVSVKKNKSTICMVMKKSCEAMKPIKKNESKARMRPITESKSDFSINKRSCESKIKNKPIRDRSRDKCDKPCIEKEVRSGKYCGKKDMYRSMSPASSVKDPCETRNKSKKDDPCKINKKTTCQSRTFDPCMRVREEKRCKQTTQSKATRYDEQCQCSSKDNKCDKGHSKDLYDRKKRDPCVIPKEWLKKYPCLMKPRDPSASSSKTSQAKMGSSKTKENPCLKVKGESSKMKDLKRQKSKTDPCKTRFKDSVHKTRSNTSKCDPSGSSRLAKPSPDIGRYESDPRSCLSQVSGYNPCDPCANNDGI